MFVASEEVGLGHALGWRWCGTSGGQNCTIELGDGGVVKVKVE